MAVLIAVQIFLFVQWEQGMITVVLFLAGIGLCIYKHPVWGKARCLLGIEPR